MAPKGKGKGKDAKKDAKAKDAKAKDKDKEIVSVVKVKKIPPPPACFTMDDLWRFREAYKACDYEGCEKVHISRLPLMLRNSGFNPTEEECQKLCEMFLEDEFVDTIEYHEFLFMVETKKNWGDVVENEVMKAFGFLAKDDEENPTGIISLETLREELFQWGEPLTEEEWADWPKLAMKDKTYDVETGEFQYKRFIENMNAKDNKFTQEPINFWKLDQRVLAAMAQQKQDEERAEMERKEEERKARMEARRLKMIEDGLLQPGDPLPPAAPPAQAAPSQTTPAAPAQ